MSEEGITWKAVYTKPRSEKKVAMRLAELGYEVYCPTRRSLKQWSDRKKWIEEPLFRSYVFVRIAESQREGVLSDPGVVAFLFWLGKPAVIRDIEIESIRNFIAQNPSAEARALSFEKGQKVLIKGGAMKDLEGVVRRNEKKHIVIEIESMGMELVAKVNREDLL